MVGFGFALGGDFAFGGSALALWGGAACTGVRLAGARTGGAAVAVTATDTPSGAAIGAGSEAEAADVALAVG